MSRRSEPQRWFFSPGVVQLLPSGDIRGCAAELQNDPAADGSRSVVVSLATEILESAGKSIPDWVDAETRYLVVSDVPEPALLRLPTLLGLHKPDLRLHVSRDPQVVKRLVIAQTRSDPVEGMVDAYVLGDSLIAVLGDMSIREFPWKQLPGLDGRDVILAGFEIDSAGSYLYWPEYDVHLGPSQMLQAVDPMYLADVEIRRYARANVSLALQDMRTDRALKQSDIPGLSERHVRRLEREETRLTVEAAEKLARAFDQDLPAFLAELGRRITALREEPARESDALRLEHAGALQVSGPLAD